LTSSLPPTRDSPFVVELSIFLFRGPKGSPAPRLSLERSSFCLHSSVCFVFPITRGDDFLPFPLGKLTPLPRAAERCLPGEVFRGGGGQVRHRYFVSSHLRVLNHVPEASLFSFEGCSRPCSIPASPGRSSGHRRPLPAGFFGESAALPVKRSKLQERSTWRVLFFWG